jgi:putative endonuclease
MVHGSAQHRELHGSATAHAGESREAAVWVKVRKFYYVYVLRSVKDRRFYIGSTNDLKERVRLHNSGGVISTKPRRPLELIFYEAYANEYDDKRREIYLKTFKGKNSLRVMLREFLEGSALEARRA